MSEASPLEVFKLACRYEDAPIFSDVSLSMELGEVMAVLGPSGCGKSTLLRCIAGLEHPTDGEIRIGGEWMVRGGHDLVPVERRHVGLVFQDYALFPNETVRGNIGFGLRSPLDPRVDELLELMDMLELADRRPAELSGGQQQRVALARALAPRPRLLLMDEPFANVDAALRQTLAQELRRLVQHEGASALFVTHDRCEALELSDRMAILVPTTEGARVAQLDVPEKIYQQPSCAEVALLVGPGTLISGEGLGSEIKTDLGNFTLAKPSQGPVTAILRPESVTFEPDPAGPCEVKACFFQGRAFRLVCDTPIGEISCEERVLGAVPAGTRGRLQQLEPCWPVSTRLFSASQTAK